MRIAEGEYTIGTDVQVGFPVDLESPSVNVHVNAFDMDATTVTNAQFELFVNATHYVTDAEQYGNSFVFDYFIDEANRQYSQSLDTKPTWRLVNGANWRHPEGPLSTIAERMDHPVVHVSRNDAIAYCQWAKKRLPTEAEWEIAAKGGTQNVLYPWGEALHAQGQHHCNVWQGDFPYTNTKEDGFASTAPAQYYEPNGYQLYQMIGNVWEWCANPGHIPLSDFAKNTGEYYWQHYQQHDDALYAIKGGSFLCHESYCKRYRIAARNTNTGMSSANNLGFRCITPI